MFHLKLSMLILIMLPFTLKANTIGDLTQSQSNTILYKSQANEYEALNKLKELNGSAPVKVIPPVEKENNGIYQTGMMNGKPETTSARKEPVVLSILGSNGKLFASFLLADGSRVEGRSGMTLPGGYRVVNINDNQVVLSKNNKKFTASHYR